MALMHCNFFSDVLGMASQMEVILPQANEGEIFPDGSLPVLYLLHGMTDNHTSWTRNTSIERCASERGMAVIMPNAHLSWYANMRYGFPYFDFIAEELPSIVRRFFPAISDRREDTFIAGNSMGGYGAFLHAFTHPERFAGAAAFSGSVDLAARMKRGSGVSKGFWSDIFGDVNKIAGGPHDLFALAEGVSASGAPKPAVWMWCGTEDFVRPYNKKMRGHLAALNWPMAYAESEGDHAWRWWDLHLPEALDWMLNVREGTADGAFAG